MIIGKKFIPLQPNFVIPVSELVSGSFEFSSHADGKFFDEFGNTDILDASIDVVARLSRGRTEFEVSVRAEGTVTLRCDRCLGELVLPVDVEDSEKLSLPEGAAELDLSQTVYDFVCTELPIVRCHPDGECDPETVRFLAGGEMTAEADEPMDNPFSSLKDILKGK